MDTLKDKQWLETMHERGEAPWEMWNTDRVSARTEALVGSG